MISTITTLENSKSISFTYQKENLIQSQYILGGKTERIKLMEFKQLQKEKTDLICFILIIGKKIC